MRHYFLILTAVIFLGACGKTAGPSANSNSSANERRYTLRGKVISVDRAKKTAVIEHGEVKDYMGPMTMPFPIKADWIWDDLKPGVEINNSDLVVDETATPPYWLENIALSAAAPPNGSTPPPVDDRFAQVGKEVPAFGLTNQDNKRISTNDFKGKAWALTFIYSRCPLPEYCIKMSTNFSDAALEIMRSPEKDKFRLLTVSFDPANDTPEKLRQYGLGYFGKDTKPDFAVWQLAVGSDKEVRAIADFFGLRYEIDQNDKTQINHSLRTAVVGPDGRVRKIFSGSDWTPGDLLAELKAASK